MASISSGVRFVLRKAASTASLIISEMFTSLRLLTKTGVYPTPMIPTSLIVIPPPCSGPLPHCAARTSRPGRVPRRSSRRTPGRRLPSPSTGGSIPRPAPGRGGEHVGSEAAARRADRHRAADVREPVGGHPGRASLFEETQRLSEDGLLVSELRGHFRHVELLCGV